MNGSKLLRFDIFNGAAGDSLTVPGINDLPLDPAAVPLRDLQQTPEVHGT